MKEDTVVGVQGGEGNNVVDGLGGGVGLFVGYSCWITDFGGSNRNEI